MSRLYSHRSFLQYFVPAVIIPSIQLLPVFRRVHGVRLLTEGAIHYVGRVVILTGDFAHQFVQ